MKCVACGAELPAGRKWKYCTACGASYHREYRRAHIEACRAHNRRWNKKHPDKVKAARKRYEARQAIQQEAA
jgi:hypothetical protein